MAIGYSRNILVDFDVLLSIILVINQLNAQILVFIIRFIIKTRICALSWLIIKIMLVESHIFVQVQIVCK